MGRHPLLSFDIIITKLGRAKMLPQMEQILQQLQHDTRHRVPNLSSATSSPSTHVLDFQTFNILIHASFLQNLVRHAYECLTKCAAETFLQTQSVGTLVHGWCKNSKLTEAFKIKEVMIGEFKLKPSVSIYTSLVKGVCEVGDLDWAFRIKDGMARNKLSLDTVVYNNLINALFKGGIKGRGFEGFGGNEGKWLSMEFSYV